jgi:3'(2'), 5'-bisphosphate nucleotidase
MSSTGGRAATACVRLRDDHQTAFELAQASGKLLLGLRDRLEAGVAPDVVRREGDRRSHELLVAALESACPDDAILSEEADHDAACFDARRLWIIDPLDGTREFGEPGRADWAVHVALVADGEFVAGAVVLPALGKAFSTRPAPPLASQPRRAPRIAVSRTRPPAEAERVRERLHGELVPMGSAGAKAMAVVTGAVDVYLHSGGQHLWDAAAPTAVALAAGCHVSRLDGTPVACDTTWTPDLLVCRPELAEQVLQALA